MDLYAKDYLLPMRGLTNSDVFVFNEIYGKEDAYQRERLLKVIKGGLKPFGAVGTNTYFQMWHQKTVFHPLDIDGQ